MSKVSGLPRLRFSRRWRVIVLLAAGILIWAMVFSQPDGRLHVTFLDVGQGDAILIQTPDGQIILVDGGPDPQAISLALGEALPFWKRTVDLVVATQPQADHVTGLVEVLQRYKVKMVLESGVLYDSAVYQEWHRLIAEKQIECNVARAGQVIALGGGVTLQVLNPWLELFQGTSSDVDNNGVVLRLQWEDVSFLLTADIRKEAEFRLVERRVDLESMVLKAAHHGSQTSTTSQFLEVVAPQVAVISVGEDNHFGHPSPEVLERLADRLGEENVYRTDKDGTIEFVTDGNRLWVQEQ
jgi:competence protein ComEC